MDFSGQREGEEVQFVFRHHFLDLVRPAMVWAGLTAVGAVGFRFLEGATGFWAWLGAFGLGAVVFLRAFVLWYFSVHVVTNQRIRQISQRGIFRRTVVDLGLDKIESVSYQVPGLAGGIFNYGTLLIQTHVGDMVITKVRDPETAYNKIQTLLVKEEYE